MELVAALKKRINEKLKFNSKSKSELLLLLEKQKGHRMEFKERVVQTRTQLGKEVEVQVLIEKDKLVHFHKFLLWYR